MKKDITFIYYLHKGDNIPFYVGKTVNKNLRKAEHKYKNKGGCKPEFVIIDEVCTDEWIFWEKYWISQFKCWGFILENRNKGGGGPVSRTEESIKKQSQSLKGHKISKETIEKINKPIIALKNGIIIEEYISLKAAGISHKTHSGNIIKYIKQKRPYHGFMWGYKIKQ
jgi:hypothetical protein